jgi:hypothetical protein
MAYEGINSITGLTMTIQNEIFSCRCELVRSVVCYLYRNPIGKKTHVYSFLVCKIGFIGNVHRAETLCTMIYYTSYMDFYSYNLIVIEAVLSTCTNSFAIFFCVF